MSDDKTGGPAFSVSSDGAQVLEYGMSMRDYFAGQALAGMMANPELDWDGVENNAAKWAYALADAMIAERAK